MKLWRCLLLIVSMATTLGCAQTVWMKDGATAQDFERDKFDCEARVVTMYGVYANMGIGHAIVAPGDIQRCMQTKDWSERAAP